jgi:hypothetical protein
VSRRATRSDDPAFADPTALSHLATTSEKRLSAAITRTKRAAARTAVSEDNPGVTPANRAFVQQAERKLGPYAAEVKRDLERGTAL